MGDTRICARRVGPFPVASEQRGAGGEPGAGALSGDHDALRVDAELVGVVVNPDESGVAVLDRIRIGVLGGEAVIDADEHDVVLVQQPAVVRVEVAEVVAEHHPTAVDRVHRARGSGAADPLDDREGDRIPEVAGHRECSPLVPAKPQPLVERFLGDVEPAHPGQHLGGQSERPACLEGGEECGEFRIERRAGHEVRHRKAPRCWAGRG
jgi:hypothetical protein